MVFNYRITYGKTKTHALNSIYVCSNRLLGHQLLYLKAVKMVLAMHRNNKITFCKNAHRFFIPDNHKTAYLIFLH